MSFELVQRITDAPNGHPRNIMGAESSIRVSQILRDAGAIVDLDYMGSYEYEDPRTLIQSANSIANAGSKLKVVTDQRRTGKLPNLVHFVCTSEQAADLIPSWHSWTLQPRTKEPTGYFEEEGYENVIGWWALNEDLIWTRESQDAIAIRDAFVALSVGAN